jgi:hypothetical protein
MPSTFPRPLAIFAVSALCLCAPVRAAQNPPPVPPARSAPATAAAPKSVAAQPPAQVQFVNEDDDRGARETRDAFNRLLEKHPPSVGRVLKLDPTLMQSPDYLATYPAIAAFLAAHPDVARNPGFFLDNVWDGDRRPTDARSQAYEMWRSLLDGIAVFVVLMTVISSLMWLIRTLIDYRRWARLTRVQQDVHTKLLDRFTNNEDLLNYMRTPAGERFLESAPISLDGDARPMAAPLRRILLGVQAGLVLLCAGVGMQFVARRIPEEVAQGVSGVGVLAVAVGFGFIASAVASYLLSARLGLITPPPGGPAAEPPARA